MPKLRAGSLLPLKVFVERYGLDGHAPRTVREVGSKYALTPNEVRAVESQVLRRLKQAVSA